MGRGVMIALRAAMTALAVFPLAELFAHWLEAPNPVPLLVLAGWMWTAAAVSLWLERRSRRALTDILVHIGAAAAAYGLWWWFLMPPDLPLRAQVFWLGWWGGCWWRGVKLAAPPAPMGTSTAPAVAVVTEFEAGLVGWAVLLVFGFWSGLPTAPLVPVLFTYFLVGLAALGWQRWNGGGVAALGGGLLLAATGGVALAAFALLFGWRRPVARGLDAIAGTVGPWLEGLLQWLFRLPPPDTATRPGPVTLLPEAVAQGAAAAPLPVGVWVLAAVLLVLVATALVMGLVVAVTALYRYLLRRLPGAASGTVTARDGRTIWRLVRAVWRLWRGRWRVRWARARRRWRHLRLALAETRRPGDLRACYRGLLRWGWLLGRARRPDETPDEYCRRLTPGLAPAAADTVRRLTDLYQSVRYDRSRADAVPPAVAAAYRRLFGIVVSWRCWLGLRRQAGRSRQRPSGAAPAPPAPGSA